MMRPSCSLWVGLFILAVLATPFAAAAGESDSGTEKYTLRYKFQPGETLRWKVVHLATVKTTVSGTTQTAETVSKSVKAWHVTQVGADGTATFENRVESVDMTQKLTGRQEVRYNSQTDKEPPAGFEAVAKSVGVLLSTITLNPKGEVVKRKQEPVAAAQSKGQITIPFPEEPVAVGQSWSFPHDVVIPLNNGRIKTVKTEQKFTLQSVRTGVATIRVATVVLTPIHDPVIEAQLIQRQSSGTVRFDVDAGLILAQQMDLDKRVIGFTPHNPNSSLHYLTRFTEDLITEKAETAQSPQPLPEPAKTAGPLRPELGKPAAAEAKTASRPKAGGSEVKQ